MNILVARQAKAVMEEDVTKEEKRMSKQGVRQSFWQEVVILIVYYGNKV